MLSSTRVRSIGPWLALAGAFAGVVAWTWGKWPDVQSDYGREVYGAWRLARGDVLRRDVAWAQGPLSVLLNALALRAFGEGLWTLFLANVALAGALAAGLFLLLRSLFAAFGATAGALAFVLVFACPQLDEIGSRNFVAPGSHELTHGVTLALGAIAAVEWHARAPRRWKPALAAFLAGAVALTRAEPALALAFALALVLLRAGRPSARWPAREAAVALGAAAVVPLLATAWLARDLGLVGALAALAEPYSGLLRDDVAQPSGAGVGASLARIALVAGGLAASGASLALVPRLLRPRAGAARPPALVAAFALASVVLGALPVPWLELLAVLPLACALALARAWRARSSGALGLFALGLALTATIELECSVRGDGFALAMPGAVACIAALAGARTWSGARWRGYGAHARAVALAGMAVWCGAHLVESARWLAAKDVRVGRGADAFLADERGALANRALERLAARGVGPVAVLPEGALLLYLARRESPTRFASLTPSDVRRWGEGEVAAALRRSRARHVVLWDGGEPLSPVLARWLQGFRSVDRIGDGPRAIELLETTRLADNVILVSIDTLRADRLGCYGADRPLTPELDRLAAGGVLFERAYAAAPWTLPSHASLFASEWPHATGIGTYDAPGHLVPEVVTLAEVLREAGLETAGFTGGGYLSDAFGLERGFDVFEGHLERSDMADVARLAGAWLDARDRSRPFFLFLHTWEVHQYDPPEAFRRRWVRPYAGALAAVDSVANFLQNRGAKPAGKPLTESDLRYARDLYDACVASVDTELGKLCERLRAEDLLERTLVVVTSDHGQEHAEHGGTGHGYTLYEEDVRVPLVVALPSLAARRVATPVSLVDLAPTIAALAGVEAPARWRGQDLLSPEHEPRSCFLGAAYRPLVGAVGAQRKVILRASGGAPCEVYDLASDPGERGSLPATDELRPLLRGLLDEYLTGAAPVTVADSRPGLGQELEALGYLGAGAGSSTVQDGALEAFRTLARDLLEGLAGR